MTTNLVENKSLLEEEISQDFRLNFLEYSYYNGGNSNGNVEIQPIKITLDDQILHVTDVDIEKGPQLYSYSNEWDKLLSNKVLHEFSKLGQSARRDGDSVLEITVKDSNISIGVDAPDSGGDNHYFWPELILTSSDYSSSRVGGVASASGQISFTSSLMGKYSRYTDGSYFEISSDTLPDQASLEINSLTGEWDYTVSEQFVDNISLNFDILLINDEDTSISHPVSIQFVETNQTSMGDLVELGRDGQPVISIRREGSLYFTTPKTNWDEATKIANSYGGHLVYINDKEEEEFIDTTYASKLKENEGDWSEQYLWTGTTGDKSGATNWGDQKAEYMRWDVGGVNGNLPGRFDRPVVIDKEGRWFTTDHENELEGIIEIPFTQYKNSAYVIVEGPTWEEAQANAVKLGGNLVSINSEEENSWIVDNLSGKDSYYPDPNDGSDFFKDSYWIGLKGVGESFQWENGDPLEYVNWGPLEPAQGDGFYGEITLIAKSPDWASEAGNWNDEIWNNPHYGIAEIPITPENRAIGFQYNLLGIDEDFSGDIDPQPKEVKKQIAVLGDSVDHNARYDLNITADILSDYMIEGADITISFDAQLFNSINASDVTIGTEFPIANAVGIDNELGTIRLAAATLSQLTQNGDDISGDTVLASISLDFDESALAGIEKNTDGSLKTNPLAFSIDANLDETVFSKLLDDGSGFGNREIQTLRDLGGTISVDGQDVTLYEAKVNLAQQGDGLVLGTKRVIGSDATTTNLVRSGDTLTTSTEWLNVGNTQANNLSYVGLYNQNASLTNADFSKSSIASGSFIDGVFIKDARESTILTTDIKITGEAGNVVDLGDGIISVQADAEGSDSFSNAGKGSSNLITYQGDLNYDGRVSMKDLAYLNAGAARQELVEGTDDNGNAVQVASTASYARDVDADFSGKIDLADLAVLDNDWGKTLHNGDEAFQGSADVSWSDLDAQGSSSSWDNSSFKDQNSIEADAAYVGSLESPAATGVIGADGNNSANDNDITGTEFQDSLSA